MEKHGRQSHWLRNTTAVIAFSVLVVAGAYTYGKYQHNQTHFNQEVTINNVNVGGMTINQAVKAVNKNSSSSVVLRNGKVYNQYQGVQQAITKQQVKQYFKQQHTDFDSSKHWNFTTKSVTEQTKELNDLNAKTINYAVGGKTFKFKVSDLYETVTFKDNQFSYGNDAGAQAMVNKINQAVATLNKSYQITTPDNQTITVQNKTYGWKVNTDKFEQTIQNAIADDNYNINGKGDIEGVGYNTRGTGYTTENNGLSNNYVLVSIKQQKLWVIRDGKAAVTLNDVVTGTNDKNKDDATPTGVYYIMYKEPNATLRGKNDDGSNYASPVSYWMPFTQSGCGLHDASWRTDWSKTAYLEGGSHGCVNIKPADIKSVWDSTFQNQAVVVYDD